MKRIKTTYTKGRVTKEVFDDGKEDPANVKTKGKGNGKGNGKGKKPTETSER